MEMAKEESEWGSVWKWKICQHAPVLKDSVKNERLKTQESRAHMNKLALHQKRRLEQEEFLKLGPILIGVQMKGQKMEVVHVTSIFYAKQK